MMSADETEKVSGAALRNSGTIHAHLKPVAETTTMLPPILLPTPVTGRRVTGL
jgi:hypothetical protein